MIECRRLRKKRMLIVKFCGEKTYLMSNWPCGILVHIWVIHESRWPKCFATLLAETLSIGPVVAMGVVNEDFV